MSFLKRLGYLITLLCSPLVHAGNSPELYVYYRVADPGGSLALSNYYSQFGQIQSQDLYYQFGRRLDDFEIALDRERISAQREFNTQIEALNRANPLLDPIQTRLESVDSALATFETQMGTLVFPTEDQITLPSGYRIHSGSEEFQSRFTNLHAQLTYLSAGTEAQAALKEFGLLALEAADQF
jgi:hypothetical protein